MSLVPQFDLHTRGHPHAHFEMHGTQTPLSTHALLFYERQELWIHEHLSMYLELVIQAEEIECLDLLSDLGFGLVPSLCIPLSLV